MLSCFQFSHTNNSTKKGPLMPEYKIKASRYDVETHDIQTFTAKNDKAARRVFMGFTKKESYSWDDLDLVKVVVPARTEKVWFVSQAKRQGRMRQEIVHHK